MKYSSQLRPLLGVSLAAVLASLVASANADTPTELTFYLNAGDTGATKVIAAFEGKNPGIKIKAFPFESEQYKTQLRIAVAGGNIPDVYITNGGTTFWEYVQRGAAMDLSEIAKEHAWASRTLPEFMAIDTDKDGHIWGMPWDCTQYWQALFYDKTFFEQHNIPIPKTIDEVARTVAMLKQNGRYGIAFGDEEGWRAIIMFGDLLLQQVPPAEIEKLNTGEEKWTTFAAARKAFEALKTLATEQAFVPGFMSMNHEAAIMSWVTKKAALMYNGTWWPSVAKISDPGFKIGVMPFPLIDSTAQLKGTQYGASSQLVISSRLQGAKKEAAIRYVDYLTSDEAMTLYGDTRKTPTTNPNANKKLTKIEPYFNEPAFTSQDSLPKMVQYTDHAFPIPVVEELKVELQKVMQQRTSIDDALESLESVHAKERAKALQ